MGPSLAIPLFAASAVLTFVAAGFFAEKLDHIGPRLGLPEAAVGLLTAFAADTPEISSAVVALVEGRKDASLGVVLGSNVFNLAAMIGLSAVVTGAVAIRRRTLAIEGTVSLLALAVASALVLGLIPAPVALGILVVATVPYLVVTLRHGPVPRGEPHRHGEGPILTPALLIVPAVVLIVVGATGMVRSALALADRWHVSQTVTGLFVLALLTSLPNAFTAVRLGLAGRGDALVTEAFASNTINVIGGIVVPACFASVAAGDGSIDLDLAWLAGLTLVTLVVLAPTRGVGRTAGAVLVCAYLAFVAVQVAIA